MPASTRRDFLRASASVTALSAFPAASRSKLDGFAIARSHQIVRERATPDFFEGMLLGNGDIGLCVTVRPDALGIHIGKSDSWDIRVSEDHYESVLSFAALLELWKKASEEAKRLGKPDLLYLEREIPLFREYTNKVEASYTKNWPRPWPCGILWIHWDANRYQVERQLLDPSNGLYRLELGSDSGTAQIGAFVHTGAEHFCVWSEEPCFVTSCAYYPNLNAQAQLPMPEIEAHSVRGGVAVSAYQRFPALAPSVAVPKPPASENDRNFVLHARIQGNWRIQDFGQRQLKVENRSDQNIDTYPSYASHPGVFLEAEGPQRLRVDVALTTPRDHVNNASYAEAVVSGTASQPISELRRESDSYWRGFWSRSAVTFEDKELERIWYHNQYWLACCLREGKVAPGLFGNWTSGKIGTAWHGDYHMNYNTQQVFWGVFSSNHAEQHFPYIEVVENLLPMSRNYAQNKFNLPGAYFPHSAYPVPSQVVPYPAPPWGYEVCETPWVVQSLWWHYLYTHDEKVLQRVYPLIREAAAFIAAYVKKGDDGRYHVIPTVSPENWGCTVDFRLNRDCIMDLALIDFLLEAAAKASELLGRDSQARDTWVHIRSHLASYPQTSSPEGTIWVDVVNAPAGWIYNIPVSLAPVFPGERVGLGSSEEQLAIARRTAQSIRLEGGNDVVYQPLIRARLGILDLDWFKNEVRYCQLPNGIVNDRLRQVGGRFKDSTDFNFMMRMGVWTENLSLPAVLNECLLQSYSGTLRLFPNTLNLGAVRFQNLRAVGAFLVSAAWDGKTVSPIEILSERGTFLRLVNPWGPRMPRVVRMRNSVSLNVQFVDDVLEFPTVAGEKYTIEPSA
jgi:alpha-L-fucosidase 2